MGDLRKVTILIDEWEKLTRKEGELIDQDLWDAVLSIQSSKRELQKALNAELGVDIKAQLASELWQIKHRIDKLIDLEKLNQKKVENKIQRAVSEYSSMKTKMDNLKKIRSAYGDFNLPSWQVYT